MKLKKVRVDYQQAWPIFEVIPKPVYRDEKSRLYRLDIYYPNKKLEEREQLEMILKINSLLAEMLEVEKEWENEKYAMFTDKEGNKYRFEKL